MFVDKIAQLMELLKSDATGTVLEKTDFFLSFCKEWQLSRINIKHAKNSGHQYAFMTKTFICCNGKTTS